MRLVLDTNVVVSGLLWDGKPARLIDAASAGDVELSTSRTLLAELTRILRRAKFDKAVAAAELSIEDLVLRYAELVTVVQPASITPTIIADPDDDHVLACALAAKVDAIVSGDPHLLNLARYQRISIIAPAEAVRLIAPRSGFGSIKTDSQGGV